MSLQSLFFRSFGGSGVSASCGVKALLLARMINDLRASVILAQKRYPMQSWTTASSAFEMAHDVGFIGKDEDRARRWVNQANITARPWPVYDAVARTFANLDLDPAGALGEYQYYRYLCLAKHGNPVIQASHNLIDDGQAMTLHIDPYFSSKVCKQLRLGLALAMRAVSSAVWISARDHVEDEEILRRALTAVGNTRDRLARYGDMDDLTCLETPESDSLWPGGVVADPTRPGDRRLPRGRTLHERQYQ